MESRFAISDGMSINDDQPAATEADANIISPGREEWVGKSMTRTGQMYLRAYPPVAQRRVVVTQGLFARFS